MTRPDSQEWLAAKADGDRAEVAVATWFRGRGFEPYRTVGEVAFDLLLQCRVEVKRDLLAPRTGNVAVETEYDGRPSGIMLTDATWWAVVVANDVHIVRTADLRQLVFAPGRPTVPAGHEHKARVALVPLDEVRQHAKTVPLPETVMRNDED